MPQNCTAELYAFMSQCWKSEPRMRPDIFQIVSSMQEKLINNSVSKKQTFEAKIPTVSFIISFIVSSLCPAKT